MPTQTEIACDQDKEVNQRLSNGFDWWYSKYIIQSVDKGWYRVHILLTGQLLIVECWLPSVVESHNRGAAQISYIYMSLLWFDHATVPCFHKICLLCIIALRMALTMDLDTESNAMVAHTLCYIRIDGARIYR